MYYILLHIVNLFFIANVLLHVIMLVPDLAARQSIQECCIPWCELTDFHAPTYGREWRQIRIFQAAMIYGIKFKVEWPGTGYDGSFICESAAESTPNPLFRALLRGYDSSFFRSKSLFLADSDNAEYGAFQYFAEITVPCIPTSLKVAKCIRIETHSDQESGLMYAKYGGEKERRNYLQTDYSLNRFIFLDSVSSTGIAIGRDEPAKRCYFIDTHPNRSSVDKYLKDSFWLEKD